MEIQFLGAAVAFFAVGIGMILYEIARNKASRPSQRQAISSIIAAT